MGKVLDRAQLRGVARADGHAPARAEAAMIMPGRRRPVPGRPLDSEVGPPPGPAVQGPPGTGKTYRAARMIIAALRAGRRVAITAPSHAAIHNLLRAVEDFAHESSYPLRGLYKGEGYASPYGLVEQVDDNKHANTDDELIAGTPWLLARDEHCGRFELLVVDEAGQFALANLAAAGACADAIVLLGDPSSSRRSPRPNTPVPRATRRWSTCLTVTTRSTRPQACC